MTSDGLEDRLAGFYLAWCFRNAQTKRSSRHQPGTRVICVDEMGPIAVKTYSGEEWKSGSNRAMFEPDYGQRGKLWVHGAFEPATGKAITPQYACWLNLIEPWWKQLRSLALKGRRFDDLDQLTKALNDALDYWNNHCHPYSWKKRPQEQAAILGGFGVQIRSDSIAI